MLDCDWTSHVQSDARFPRPAEVDHLIGDASKAKRLLGREPQVDFSHLVRMMVDADLERLSARTPVVTSLQTNS